jgi:hypothetical protein
LALSERAVDALYEMVPTSKVTKLEQIVAITSNMSYSHSTAIGLFQIEHQNLFMYHSNSINSIKAHFQDGAENMSLFLVPNKAANMLIMHNSYQITSK